MTTAGEHAVPDRERAETYLRLQAEAELRKALTFPRYREPRRKLLARHQGFQVISASRPRSRRRRAVAIGRLSQARYGSRLQPSQVQVTGLIASRAEAMLNRFAGQAGRALATGSGRTALGVQRIGWQLRRRPGRTYQPPPAEACLGQLVTLAAALCDAGAVDEATADFVVEDLRTSLAARSLLDPGELIWARFRSWHRAARQPTPAGPFRAIPVGATADLEVDGEVARAYLGAMILDSDVASLTVTAKFLPTLAEEIEREMPEMEVLHHCTATDDRGGTYHAHFSGGGGSDRWDGQFDFEPVPAAHVRWLDVALPGADPVRIPLDTAPAVLPTTAVQLPASEAADRFLDVRTVEVLVSGCAWGPDDGEDPELVTIASGLLAAGVVAPTGPALGRLAAVAARLGLDLPVPLAEIRPGTLPTDWLGLLARCDRDDGPAGVIPVAAVLPELDGMRCAIAELESDPKSATIRVHARGWPYPDHHGRMRQPQPYRWTARDDVGGWYLASEHGRSYSSERADLDLRLHPAIDPQARELQIILTGRTGEVSVTVPLTWQEDL
jgi:hypothetical protein